MFAALTDILVLVFEACKFMRVHHRNNVTPWRFASLLGKSIHFRGRAHKRRGGTMNAEFGYCKLVGRCGVFATSLLYVISLAGIVISGNRLLRNPITRLAYNVV